MPKEINRADVDVKDCRVKKRQRQVRMGVLLVFTLCFSVSMQLTLWVLTGTDCEDHRNTGVVAAGYDELENEQLQAKKIIVIDAGHGGMDGGALAADGTQEKDINLAVAKALAEIAAEYPIEVIMTREDDSGLYTDDERSIREKKREDLQNRKKLMEQEGVLLGISIHLNSFPQDEKVYGAQVFYPLQKTEKTSVQNVTGDEDKAGVTSRDFAEAVQKSLEINIDDGRERSAMMKNDILLFKNANTNMILAECGFLSNAEEAEKLKTAEYQQLLAQAIWDGVNEILCMEKSEKVEIIVSANKEK